MRQARIPAARIACGLSTVHVVARYFRIIRTLASGLGIVRHCPRGFRGLRVVSWSAQNETAHLSRAFRGIIRRFPPTASRKRVLPYQTCNGLPRGIRATYRILNHVDLREWDGYSVPSSRKAASRPL